MDKSYTSKVETTREHFEEPEKISGQIIKSTQIWRDANLIPETAPSYIGKLYETYDSTGTAYKYGKLTTFNDGATVRNLISYYDGLPLKRVEGTINCYSHPELKNIILEDSGSTYIPKIFINGHKLAYELGKPVFDVAAGTLYFSDNNFAIEHSNDKVSISFYRYIGRMGSSVGENNNNVDLPFRDDIKHFKDATNDDRTATFKVRGEIKNSNYILPPTTDKWYNKGDEEGSVLLTQETLEDTLWEQNTKISGGLWYSQNNITGVAR